MIYHIAQRKDWIAALDKRLYAPGSLSKEGFIHCSPIEKVLQVANNFYKGIIDLVLLQIDELKVKNIIKWENLYDHGFEFPHIYGTLNLDAVVNVSDFNPDANGNFNLPAGII